MANKTKIEWCDYTINPVKGLCPVGCQYCYARAMYKRFKWNQEIRYDRYLMPEMIEGIQQPSRIFVGSTMELFGEWIYPHWMEHIFTMVKHYKEQTFIFLTKKPENLIKWSPFPDNCWIGISCTKQSMYNEALTHLDMIQASVKFISFEPLLSEIVSQPPYDIETSNLDWIIIGQQTPVRSSTMPGVGWIQEIIQAADTAGIPVFLKDNLVPVVDQYEFATTGVWPDIHSLIIFLVVD